MQTNKILTDLQGNGDYLCLWTEKTRKCDGKLRNNFDLACFWFGYELCVAVAWKRFAVGCCRLGFELTNVGFGSDSSLWSCCCYRSDSFVMILSLPKILCVHSVLEKILGILVSWSKILEREKRKVFVMICCSFLTLTFSDSLQCFNDSFK